MSVSKPPTNDKAYLFDSFNTRVPPMNISGKKSNASLSYRFESPLYHSRSYQHFPKPNILLREESPPIRLPMQPEPEKIILPPPPPIRNIRPAVNYRPALMNLSNQKIVIPRPKFIPRPNLNPFEVVEQLFYEEENMINNREKFFKPLNEPIQAEPFTEQKPLCRDANSQTVNEEEKPLIKNNHEHIPTVPNEDKSDPNIKIASYIVSPVNRKSYPEKNESFRAKSEKDSEKMKQKKNFDDKKRFLKGMIEEIDEFLLQRREIDKKREQELNSIKAL